MEKKANKFVYSIAKKLVESEGCHKVPRQKLLQLFENVIKSMPKKDPLKTELQRNIATYTNKLDRCIAKKQAALGKETSISPSNGLKDEAEGKDEEEEEEAREEEEDVSEYPINLYANGGFVRAVEHLERTEDTKLGVLLLSQAHLADDGVDERIEHVMVKSMKKLSIGKSPMQQVEDRIQLYRKEMMILVGNRELKPLMQCLNRFHKNMTPEVESIIEKKQVECGKKLQEFFLDFLSSARFQFGQIAQKESIVPSYEDLIAAIMALFIDLSIFLSRGQSKSASHYGKKALSRLQLLLGHAPLSILYVLLQLSEPGQQDAEFMMPIYKKVLRQAGDTSCPYYCSFVIACRQACELLQETYPQECSNILQTCHSMKVPYNILSWLSDRTPQIVESLPTKVKRDVNKLASYLLREATEDTCDALLDGMSLVVDTSKEEEMEEEKEEQEELFFVDTSKHTQTPDAGDGAPLFFTDTSLHTESSESDTSKALKHSINSLIIGLDSDNKQDKSSSDQSSHSEDEDEVMTAVRNKRQARVSSTKSTSIRKSSTVHDQDVKEDELEEESDEEEEESEKEQDGESDNEREDRRRTRQQSLSVQQRRRPAVDQKNDSSDDDMEVDESEEEGQIEKDEDDEASSGDDEDDESDEKDDDQGDEEKEASDREQSDEEQVDEEEEEKDASDSEQSDKDEEQRSEDENDQDEEVEKSPRKVGVGRQPRFLSQRGKKSGGEEKHQEKDAVHSARMRRNTRQSKVGESITSNTDESFRTCDDMDEKDVFFEADDSISFKNTSPVKTPPSKEKSRTFLGTSPNTYLSQSTRRSTRLRPSESKREPNQTTLDKFFLSQPAKSALSPSGEEVIIIPETQLSGGDDDDINKTAESKTTSKRLSRRLIVKKVDKREGTESPVFELTESQLSNTTPQPYAHVVPESDDGGVQKYQEKQLEDIVIQGIKKIRKSSPPSLEDVVTQGIKKIRKSTSQPQSPKRHSPRKSHGGGKGQQYQGQEQEIGSLTPPSSPIPMVVVEVNGSLIGSKKDIGNDHVSTTLHSGKKGTAMMKSKMQLSTSPRTHKVSSKDSKTQVTSTSSTKAKHASASKVTSPPSAKKAAADFGNVYRMMAGIGLSQDSQASSLEDFQLPSTSKKSPLQPKVLLEKFPIDDSNQFDVKDKDGTVNVDSVKGLRSRTVSESEMSEASVSSVRRSSRRRNVEQSTTQVMGKPPIPQTSSRRGLKTATSSRGNGNEVHHSSEDEPSSPPRSRRRSKRNSESSVASEASMPKSPQRRQKVIQTNKKSHSSVKQAAVSNKTNSKEFPSVPLTCPARIRRSKRISESSADGEQPSTSKKSRNFRSILAIPRIDSSQESGIYPLPSSNSLSSEGKQSELVDPASSPVHEDVDDEFEHTLRSRTVSGGSSQDDESIMGSQESFTVTQFLRRDRDRRNRKYASKNDDGDVVKKEGLGPKKTSQSSEKKRLSLSQGPSSTSRSRTRRKSSQKK